MNRRTAYITILGGLVISLLTYLQAPIEFIIRDLCSSCSPDDMDWIEKCEHYSMAIIVILLIPILIKLINYYTKGDES